MKPLFMRLKAFGPFASEIDISFDRVFDGGLFLIHGRTGAGKTSLLDGLCFSLFGRPSSEEREKEIRGLRSDLADKTTMTETELVFTIGLQSYRVHRIPTQQTPKKRGEGFTEHKGSAELYRLDGSNESLREVLHTQAAPDFLKLSWIPIAGKVEAVDAAIEGLLGMNERQFRQVVVLPQGKFREFLSSTSSDRQTILEKLFQTDRFSRLQQYISTRARSSEASLREGTQGLQTKLEALGISSVQEIGPRISELKTNSDEASKKLLDARQRSEELGHELNQAKEFERSTVRFQALSHEAELLERRKEEVAGLKRHTIIARLWSPFFSVEEQTTALERKQQGRESSKEQTEKAVLEFTHKKQTAEERLQGILAKKPSLEEIGIELTRLRSVAVLLKDIEKSAAALVLDETKTAKSREQIILLEKRVAALELERHSGLRSLIQIDEAERGQESATLETEDLRIKGLELEFHHSEASRLASLLSPGAACPVCGSLEHPRPARANSDGAHGVKITDEFIRSQKGELEKLRQDLTERRTRRQSRLEPLLALLKVSQLTTSDSPRLNFSNQAEAFDETSRALQTATHAIEVQQAEINTRGESIKAARESIDLRRRSVPESDRIYDEVVKRGTELKLEQETREPQIKHFEKEVLQFGSELSRLLGTRQALADELEQIRRDLEELREKRDTLKREIEKKVRLLYPDEISTPAPVSELELQAAEAETEKHSLQVLKNAAALSEVKKLLERVKASRASSDILIDFEGASELRSNLEQTAARLSVEIEGLAKLAKETAVVVQKLAGLKNEAERAMRMSALLTGDRTQNKLLVPLSRFVLQSRFDEVLEQANRRLARMSRGQFQLRRPALSQNLRDSQGLEIRVEDANAGTERHAGSLSGGESFMAALSLALGLADVVQADLGGVKLDSVLIDEGFGTLDSESLDLAMKTLVDLQAGGRIVGIISHVQEIKSQISHRLEVTKAPQGSAVLWNALI